MKKKVLICDDDEDILNLCQLILERNNYQVETSKDCESVLPRITDIDPDVILMDLWIPVMGGEALVKILKADDVTRHIPVIIFSANNEIEKIANRLNAAFLPKPFQIKDLLRIVEQHAR